MQTAEEKAKDYSKKDINQEMKKVGKTMEKAV